MTTTDVRHPPQDSLGTTTKPIKPDRTGFRPAPRRRARIAAGAALAALAVGGNVVLYTSLDQKTEVVQIVRNVRAGDPVSRADIRIVEVDLDSSIPVVHAANVGLIVGQFARVFIPSGSIVTTVQVQPAPLVAAGKGIVSVEIRPTRVPSGLRERSQVLIVVIPDNDQEPLFETVGRVVARSAEVDGVAGVVPLSVEVSEHDAATVAAGNDVRIVLLDPSNDPVRQENG
jgi:hypothetical protein